jgi:hypothetical protein
MIEVFVTCGMGDACTNTARPGFHTDWHEAGVCCGELEAVQPVRFGDPQPGVIWKRDQADRIWKREHPPAEPEPTAEGIAALKETLDDAS